MIKRHYLRKGAKFKYHGQISMFGAIHDDADNAFKDIRLHFTPDVKKSGLFTQLCARDNKSGKCTFPSVVTLASTVACNGRVECEADNIRSVKIVDGAMHGYYTYIEPPCTPPLPPNPPICAPPSHSPWY